MPQSRAEAEEIVLRWRQAISANAEAIRHSQDEALLSIDEEHLIWATTAMAGIAARAVGGTIMSNVNNTSIGTAGAVVTGGRVKGNVTGTVQNVGVQKDALEGIAKLRSALASAPELTLNQKEDVDSALDDLEEQVKKEPAEQSGGKVRNAISTIGAAVTIAKSAEFLYSSVLPHLHSFFHFLG